MSFCISSATFAGFPQTFTPFLIESLLFWSECCLLLFFVAVIVLVGLLLWRFGAFTVVPLLHPNQPKEVPYWIPCE